MMFGMEIINVKCELNENLKYKYNCCIKFKIIFYIVYMFE